MRAWRRHAQRWLTIFSKWWLKQQRRRRRRERQAEAEEEETFWASSSNLPRELFYSICEECSCCCCCVNRTNSSIDPVQKKSRLFETQLGGCKMWFEPWARRRRSEENDERAIMIPLIRNHVCVTHIFSTTSLTHDYTQKHTHGY